MGQQSSAAPTDCDYKRESLPHRLWVMSGLPLASGRLQLDWVPTAKWTACSAIHGVVWTVQQSLG